MIYNAVYCDMSPLISLVFLLQITREKHTSENYVESSQTSNM